jgi:hypothetical protein
MCKSYCINNQLHGEEFCEQLIVIQLVREFTIFMKPEGSLLCSLMHSTCILNQFTSSQPMSLRIYAHLHLGLASGSAISSN